LDRWLLRGAGGILMAGMVLAVGCRKNGTTAVDSGRAPRGPGRESVAVREAGPPAGVQDPNMAWPRPRTDERINDRRRMVETIRDLYGLKDLRVLEAMLNVPRHWFVPPSQAALAYMDTPLPIGYEQTISQPYIVAYMTHVLDLHAGMKVLEVGTGSGYQAAVLNELTPRVYTIEILRPLAERAIETFKRHGYGTIRVRIGDGYAGWPEEAPFDAIIVTCAPDHIPQPLLDQVKPGGRMVIPVGSRSGLQDLILVTKDAEGRIRRKSRMPVRFVPLLREGER